MPPDGKPRDGKSPQARSTRPVGAQQLARWAEQLKALGDPTRLGIVAMLARSREPLCVCEIERGFALSQSTISHHLGLLRKAGLLHAEKRGTWAFYALTAGAERSLKAVLGLLGEPLDDPRLPPPAPAAEPPGSPAPAAFTAAAPDPRSPSRTRRGAARPDLRPTPCSPTR